MPFSIGSELWHPRSVETISADQERRGDSLIVPQCVYKPGSFTGLMTLYESNYIKLAELLDLDDIASERCSICAADCDLHLLGVERERYTTTLRLTYVFSESGEDVLEPNLTLRIYHDARLAEALRWRGIARHKQLKAISDHTRALSDRWRANMLLNKWLDYLIDCGHSFRVPVRTNRQGASVF